jgi:hypothetical protein
MCKERIIANCKKYQKQLSFHQCALQSVNESPTGFSTDKAAAKVSGALSAGTPSRQFCSEIGSLGRWRKIDTLSSYPKYT